MGTRVIALLRGINVGGHKKIKMADLRRAAEDLGFARVQSYIQSGNLVFDTPLPPMSAAWMLETAIEERWGFQVPVIARRREELVAARAACPYAGQDEERLIHLAFLERTPAPEAVAALDPDRSPPTRFTVIGAEVHVHYEGGSARSKVTLGWLEKGLGTRATGRNLRTVDKLIALAGEG